MKLLKKILPICITSFILGLVIWYINPPKSITSASILQFILFFIPLVLLLTSLVNLCSKFFLQSLVVSLGLTILLILIALDSLNLASFILTSASVILIAKSLRKPKKINYPFKIPKLKSLKKQK